MNAVRTAIIFVLAVSFVTLMPWRAVRAIAASADLTDPPSDPKPSKTSEVQRLKAEIEELRKEDEQKLRMMEALAHRIDQLEAEQKQSAQKQQAQIDTAVATKIQEQQVSPKEFSGFLDQYHP